MRLTRTLSIAVAGCLVAIADVPEGVTTWQPWMFLLAALSATALATRVRSRPAGAVMSLVAMLAIAIGAEAAGKPGQFPFGVFLVVGFLIADVALHERARVALAVALLATIVGVAAEGLADDRGTTDVAFVAMLWALAGAVALAVRWRRQASDARDERVRMLERERIARDLHDVVAHHVSAIALTAEGARGLVGRDDALVGDSLASIHATSATALDEMRRMVAMLRSDGGHEAPLRLSDIASSVVDDRSLNVEFSIADNITEPATPVVAGASRIVQEAVTNSRRHAREATKVTVDVRLCDGDLLLTISDDGRNPTGRAGGGYGLAGMRERASALGGSCRAEPGESGGWVVEARLPLEASR